MSENLNRCLNELKSILYTKVNNYNKNIELSKELKNKLDILKETIDILYNKETKTINLKRIEQELMQLGLLLQSIYGNTEGNRIYDIITTCIFAVDKDTKKLRILLNKLIKEYNETLNEIRLLSPSLKHTEPLIIEYKRILSNYKYNGLITNKQTKLIEDIMKEYDFSKKDQIRIFESIRTHNLIKKYKEDAKISYTVVEMLDTNLTKYDIDNDLVISDKDRLSKIIDSFYQSIKDVNTIEEIFILMPNFEDQTYSYEEFMYIYESILNKIIDDLLDSIKEIQNQEIYQDIDLRKVVIQEFNENKFKYKKLLEVYNTRKNEYIENYELEQNLKQQDNNKTPKNFVFFQTLPTNKDISYLEKDLKKYPEEYLNKIHDLIERIINNNLTRDKFRVFTANNGVLKGYMELRDDQVRIICKMLPNNCYCIVGTFVKKDDMNHTKFYNITGRNITLDISTPELFKKAIEDSNKNKETIYEYIKTNARKESR